MIAMEVFMDIIALRRQGCSLREISHKLGIHRTTVKKYLTEGRPPRYQKSARSKSILDPYRQMIDDWLEQDNYRASRIYRQIKNLGYCGGYDMVKIYVRKVKAGKHRQAFLRFETIPGMQGQVDWADFKVATAGAKDISLYLFIMVLGFSRAMYAQFVTTCSLQAFLDAHLSAFHYLGGVPLELLYDNMRHVFIGTQNGRRIINVELMHFANHCMFKPILCPPHTAPGSKARWSAPSIISVKASGAATSLMVLIRPMPICFIGSAKRPIAVYTAPTGSRWIFVGVRRSNGSPHVRRTMTPPPRSTARYTKTA